MNKWISLVLCGAFLAFQTASADIPASDDVTKTTTDDSTDSTGGLLGGSESVNVNLYCFNQNGNYISQSASLPLCHGGWYTSHLRNCDSSTDDISTATSASDACGARTDGYTIALVGSTNNPDACGKIPHYSSMLLSDPGICVVYQ